MMYGYIIVNEKYIGYDDKIIGYEVWDAGHYRLGRTGEEPPKG